MKKTKNFFGDIASSTKETTKNFFNTDRLSDTISNLPHDMWRPVQNMKDFKPFKNNPLETGGQLLNLGFTTLLPGALVYDAINPTHVSSDTHGPFESMGSRIGSLLGAAVIANNRLHHGRSIIGDHLGEIIGSIGTGLGLSYGGKALDRLTGNKVPKNVLMSKFQNRVEQFSNQLSQQFPYASPDQIHQEAVNQILSQADGYMELFRDK